MLLAFFIIKIIEIILYIVSAIIGEENNLLTFINPILNFFGFLIVQLISILILINQRKNEYNADDFVLNNGYGADLIELLYVLQKLDFSGKKSLLERLKSSHPYITDRIVRLEEKMEFLESLPY